MTMTVRELIEHLAQFDEDKLVVARQQGDETTAWQLIESHACQLDAVQIDNAWVDVVVIG